MSWRITATAIHSDVRRVLDELVPEAIRQGANPDVYADAARAAAALSLHVGRSTGGVAIEISGHGDTVAEVKVSLWDVKSAAKLADQQRAAEAKRRTEKQAREERERAERERLEEEERLKKAAASE